MAGPPLSPLHVPTYFENKQMKIGGMGSLLQEGRIIFLCNITCSLSKQKNILESKG